MSDKSGQAAEAVACNRIEIVNAKGEREVIECQAIYIDPSLKPKKVPTEKELAVKANRELVGLPSDGRGRKPVIPEHEEIAEWEKNIKSLENVLTTINKSKSIMINKTVQDLINKSLLDARKSINIRKALKEHGLKLEDCYIKSK